MTVSLNTMLPNNSDTVLILLSSRKKIDPFSSVLQIVERIDPTKKGATEPVCGAFAVAMWALYTRHIALSIQTWQTVFSTRITLLQELVQNHACYKHCIRFFEYIPCMAHLNLQYVKKNIAKTIDNILFLS